MYRKGSPSATLKKNLLPLSQWPGRVHQTLNNRYEGEDLEEIKPVNSRSIWFNHCQGQNSQQGRPQRRYFERRQHRQLQRRHRSQIRIRVWSLVYLGKKGTLMV